MRPTLFQLQDVLKVFERRKVVTKQVLLRETGCSAMTAWRLLHQHGYFSSYNHNAGYYTLLGIAQFDEHGLWAYRDARFSKWGSLTDTLVGLVEGSVAGLSAEQLQQLLHVQNVKPILTRLSQRGALTRVKMQGRFIYFPRQKKAHAKQEKRRKKAQDQDQEQTRPALPSLEHIIALLVEIIRRPHNASSQWARRLAQQGIHLRTSDIRAVMDHYHIDVKKGLLKS